MQATTVDKGRLEAWLAATSDAEQITYYLGLSGPAQAEFMARLYAGLGYDKGLAWSLKLDAHRSAERGRANHEWLVQIAEAKREAKEPAPTAKASPLGSFQRAHAAAITGRHSVDDERLRDVSRQFLAYAQVNTKLVANERAKYPGDEGYTAFETTTLGVIADLRAAGESLHWNTRSVIEEMRRDRIRKPKDNGLGAFETNNNFGRLWGLKFLLINQEFLGCDAHADGSPADLFETREHAIRPVDESERAEEALAA